MWSVINRASFRLTPPLVLELADIFSDFLTQFTAVLPVMTTEILCIVWVETKLSSLTVCILFSFVALFQPVQNYTGNGYQSMIICNIFSKVLLRFSHSYSRRQNVIGFFNYDLKVHKHYCNLGKFRVTQIRKEIEFVFIFEKKS